MTRFPSLEKLLCLSEAAALGTGAVHGSTVKPTREEACASLCGCFHRARLVENNVLEVITTITATLETVTVMWFISIPLKCQESELHSSEE